MARGGFGTRQSALYPNVAGPLEQAMAQQVGLAQGPFSGALLVAGQAERQNAIDAVNQGLMDQSQGTIDASLRADQTNAQMKLLSDALRQDISAPWAASQIGVPMNDIQSWQQRQQQESLSKTLQQGAAGANSMDEAGIGGGSNLLSSLLNVTPLLQGASRSERVANINADARIRSTNARGTREAQPKTVVTRMLGDNANVAVTLPGTDPTSVLSPDERANWEHRQNPGTSNGTANKDVVDDITAVGPQMQTHLLKNGFNNPREPYVGELNGQRVMIWLADKGGRTVQVPVPF